MNVADATPPAGGSGAASPVESQRGWDVLLGILILAVYVALSVACSRTFRPDADEAGYASPAYNLIHNGRMGTTLYEVRGYMPASLERRTYWQPPLHFLATALWFRVFGVGLFQLRTLSMAWGLLLLGSWYTIVRGLGHSRRVALAAVAFVSLDYFFMLGTSSGRMDMMCAALGSAALAVYIQQRSTSLARAVFFGQGLAVLAGLTHPAGIVYAAGVAFLMLYWDRKSLSLKLLAVAAAPYALGAAGWGAYILQDPAAFVAQFSAGMTGTGRYSGIDESQGWRVFQAVKQEVMRRYVAAFGLGPGVGALSRLKAVALAAYLLAMLGTLWRKRLRREGGVLLVCLIAMNVVILALISPSKYFFYLPHTTVFMAACLGLFLCRWSASRAWRRGALGAGLLVVGGVQAGGLVYRIHQNLYERQYLHAVRCVESNSVAHSLVMAPGELWFGLQPERTVLQDGAFGYRSGLKPDIVVTNPMFRSMLEVYRRADAPAFLHVKRLLDGSQLVCEDENYRVYRPLR